MTSIRSLALRLIGVFVVTAVVFSGIDAEAKERETEEQRLVSIVEKGPIATITLADGSKVDVAKSDLKIKRPARSPKQEGVEQQSGRKMPASELASLTAAGGAVHALVKLRYADDGTVRKAKVRLFASDAALSAYVAEREQRRQAVAAATAKDRAAKAN